MILYSILLIILIAGCFLATISTYVPGNELVHNSFPNQYVGSRPPIASSAPPLFQASNELPDQIQWDTIEKLEREIVLEFIQKIFEDIIQANDYSARGSPKLSVVKVLSPVSDSMSSLPTVISRLADSQIVIRNLTFFMALIYMDRIANQVSLLFGINNRRQQLTPLYVFICRSRFMWHQTQ